MEMNNPMYNKKVLDHFKNPRNMGVIKNPDAEATVGNRICGDVMKIMIKVKDDRIKDIKFQTMGCTCRNHPILMGQTQFDVDKNLIQANLN